VVRADNFSPLHQANENMMHPCTPCTQNHGKIEPPREKIEAEFEKIQPIFGKIQPIFFCTEPPCNRKWPTRIGTDLSDDEKMSNHIKTELDERRKEYFQQKKGAGGDKRGFHTPRNAHLGIIDTEPTVTTASSVHRPCGS